MPMATFWMLHKNIDRMNAESDIRSTLNSAASQAGEAIKDHLEGLRGQLGKVIEFDEARRLMNAKRDVVTKAERDAINRIGDLSVTSVTRD